MADGQSPHSVQSSISGMNGSEADTYRQAADSAAAAVANEIAAAAAAAAASTAASAHGTPHARDATSRIPTVLSFNHLQSQAESVVEGAAVALGGGPGAAG